jgi:phage gp36-like protein
MAFITEDDFKESIKENVLDAIVNVDNDRVKTAISRAIQQIKGYLSARYDVNAILAQTEDDRNPVVLMYGLDIAIYHLHLRLNSRKIPDFRKERYKEALDWFEKVNKGEINDPDLPLPEDPEDKSYVNWGSNPKRENHI